MHTSKVVVVNYDPAWRQEFEKIKGQLEDVLSAHVLSIEHVGSTSVEGLAAKPIIDIDIVIADISKFQMVKFCLELLGYWHEGDLGIPGREAFAYLGKPDLLTHHLYVCTRNSAELRRHIGFRDYLRSHPEDRDQYSRVKQEAAKKFPDDIDAYLEEKDPFIRSIYDKCSL